MPIVYTLRVSVRRLVSLRVWVLYPEGAGDQHGGFNEHVHFSCLSDLPKEQSSSALSELSSFDIALAHCKAAVQRLQIYDRVLLSVSAHHSHPLLCSL